MPLPPEVDQRIRQRFESLLLEAEELFQETSSADDEAYRRRQSSNVIMVGFHVTIKEKYYSLRTKFLTLLHTLSIKEREKDIEEQLLKLEGSQYDIPVLLGFIRGLKDDYESGMLDNISRMIEAEVTADYLGQAERLLQEGQPGKFDHVPAAVLIGATLEDALRRLCHRQMPPIALTKPSGEPKTLNPLIDDLKKAGVFNELKAKQLRSWADIRNQAAHGEFTQFNRQDVEQMIVGVENFLADYL